MVFFNFGFFIYILDIYVLRKRSICCRWSLKKNLLRDFENWVTLQKAFILPKDEKGVPLEKNKWTESQIQRSKANEKIINLLLDIVSKEIL